MWWNVFVKIVYNYFRRNIPSYKFDKFLNTHVIRRHLRNWNCLRNNVHCLLSQEKSSKVESKTNFLKRIHTNFSSPLKTTTQYLSFLVINCFMTEVPMLYKPVHWFAQQIVDRFLCDKDLRHWRVNFMKAGTIWGQRSYLGSL